MTKRFFLWEAAGVFVVVALFVRLVILWEPAPEPSEKFNSKIVSFVKRKAGDPVFTINGLFPGLPFDRLKQSLPEESYLLEIAEEGSRAYEVSDGKNCSLQLILGAKGIVSEVSSTSLGGVLEVDGVPSCQTKGSVAILFDSLGPGKTPSSSRTAGKLVYEDPSSRSVLEVEYYEGMVHSLRLRFP